MKREYVGSIGVDSGSVMIVDPCYFNDPMRWNPKLISEMAIQNEKEGNIRMASNSRRIAKEKTELQNIVQNWNNFCADSAKANFEAREYAGGIISPTRNGDGEYSVYVTKDKDGNVKKMEIEF